MQGIKESSTLRIGNKKDKPPPKIIYLFGSQDKQISEFLEKRQEIKIIDIISSEN
jgi:hypothetical protein